MTTPLSGSQSARPPHRNKHQTHVQQHAQQRQDEMALMHRVRGGGGDSRKEGWREGEMKEQDGYRITKWIANRWDRTLSYSSFCTCICVVDTHVSLSLSVADTDSPPFHPPLLLPLLPLLPHLSPPPIHIILHPLLYIILSSSQKSLRRIISCLRGYMS